MSKTKAVTGSVPSPSSPTLTTPSVVAQSAAGASTGGTSIAGSGAPLGTVATPPKGFRLQVLLMLQGVQAVLPAGSVVSTASGPLTQAAMVSQLQSVMQAYQAVDDDRVTLKQSLQQVTGQLPGWREQYAQLKATIIAFFGASSPQLGKFGLKPKSKKVLTTAQKMARDARSKQTRVLRGTKGKKAKLAIQYTGPIEVSAQPTPEAGASSAPAQATSGAAVAASTDTPAQTTGTSAPAAVTADPSGSTAQAAPKTS